ncbi:MAG TPA: hypothetical protein P5550_07105, partial [Bacteroidales bacterium]|nr:hypothetical protein [Bacteroidales bacterium]
GALQGWTNASTGEYLWANEPQDACQPLAFSGIHFLSERVLDLFPDEVRFPLLPHYLRLAHGLVIGTWRHDEGQWTDLGRPEDLQNMRDWLSSVQGQDWIKKYHRGWSPS